MTEKIPPKPLPLPPQSHLSIGWNPIEVLMNYKYSRQQVNDVREYIHAVMYEKMDGKINRIDCYRDSDVLDMIFLYDELLFANCIKKSKYKDQKGNVGNYKIYGVMDEHYLEAGGVTEFVNEHSVAITLNRYFHRDTFENKEDKVNNNSRCYDRLGCMQQTLEHELIHMLIFLFPLKQREDDHGPTFKALSKNIFDVNTKFSYLQYNDVHIYEGRANKIVNRIKVGDKIQVRQTNKTKNKNNLPVTVTRLPTALNEDEEAIITIKYDSGTIREIPATLIKTPPEIVELRKPASRENTSLSPIAAQASMQKVKEFNRVQKLRTKITLDDQLDINKVPKGLSWPQFRSYIIKNFGGRVDVSLLWKQYKESK